MIRMRKIVPASRRVSEASFESPSSDRRGPMGPASEAVAGCASMTARREFRAVQGRPPAPAYQQWLKIWWRLLSGGAPELLQIDVELVGALATHQRQLQGRCISI